MAVANPLPTNIILSTCKITCPHCCPAKKMKEKVFAINDTQKHPRATLSSRIPRFLPPPPQCHGEYFSCLRQAFAPLPKSSSEVAKSQVRWPSRSFLACAGHSCMLLYLFFSSPGLHSLQQMNDAVEQWCLKSTLLHQHEKKVQVKGGETPQGISP